MDLHAEWLETDGLGGYATGTIDGLRTRRYHALLCSALTPPTGRHVLVNGVDAFVETEGGRFALSSQRYASGVVAPDGRAHVVAFDHEPWPTWTFRLEDGTEIVHELFAVHGSPTVVASWRLAKRSDGPATLTVRPFLSGRDHHALHHENGAFRFDAQVAAEVAVRRGRAYRGSRVTWQPYESLPKIVCVSSGSYRHDPHWYRAFHYDEEAARGFEADEDLGSPGEFTFDLTSDEALWIVGTEPGTAAAAAKSPSAVELARRLRASETRRRAKFRSPLWRAADQFVVQRNAGRTIVAGYPWFTDWGRDTFLAMRGLCVSSGRLDEARAMLLEWAAALSEGMVPTRFPDRGDAPEYNNVDASLWFVVAVEELLAAPGARRAVSRSDERKLLAAVLDVLETHAGGARFGIRMDQDALLAAGEPGQQLTWMDARADGREVTPRIGKPVEIQALWYEALCFAAKALKGAAHWQRVATRVRNSFLNRFWNQASGALHDVVDVDHVADTYDASFRPNQVLAVGGLRHALLVGPRARQVVDAVEKRLWTPMGLRTLAPDDTRYRARYEGDSFQRDSAYHQGSVWPWLVGPFVDAWVRVRDGRSARREAFDRFVRPLLERMAKRGVPHLCEVTDGDAPQRWSGCPFQAWSLAELLRLAPNARFVRSTKREMAQAAKA